MVRESDKLYNQKQKEDFIEYYQEDSTNPYVRNIFKATRADEEFKQKDICEFTEKEIIAVLKGFNTTSINTLRVKTSILRSYAVWCEANGYILNNMNCFNNLYGKDIEDCVNKHAKQSKLISYELLLEYCHELLNPIDKFILCAVFEGIRGKKQDLIEITSLRLKDLHKDYFDLIGRKIKVPSYLYELAIQAVESNTYVTTRGQEKKLFECDYVFKPKFNYKIIDNFEEDNIVRIRKRMSNLKSTLNAPEMTTASLYYSGMIYYMGQIASEKNIEILDVINEPEYEEIKEKYQITLPNYAVRANIKSYLL